MNRFTAPLVLAILMTATMPVSAGPTIVPPCLVPDQIDDAFHNVEHLLAELQLEGAPATILSPDLSPHVARITIPFDVIVAHPLYLVNIEVIVCGDVLVLPTGSITMYGATLRLAHPERPSQLRVMGAEDVVDRITGEGALEMRPLSRVHEDPRIGGLVARVLFTHPERLSLVEGTPGRPVTVDMDAGSRLFMEQATLRESRGIEVNDARVVARDSKIESRTQGIYAFEARRVDLERTEVSAKTVGVYATTTNDVHIEDSTISAATGIHFTGAEGARFLDNAIRATRDGIYVFDSGDVRVRGGSILATSGVYAASSHEVEVAHVAIEARGTAVTFTDTIGSRIAWNVLLPAPDKAVRGVYLERTSEVTLEGNVARGMDIGYHLLTGEYAELRCNVAEDNKRAVYVSTTVDVLLRDNTLVGSELVDLHGYLSPAIDARGNWWGNATGPTAGQIFEGTLTSVDASDHLSAPSACVPPARDDDRPWLAWDKPRQSRVYLEDVELEPLRGVIGPTVALGDLTVRVDAVDNGTGVERVELYVDGLYAASDAYAPYAFDLDVGLLGSGVRSLTAVAYDHAGNHASIEAWLVIVDAAPVGL